MRFQIDIGCDNAAFTNEDGDYDYSNPSEEVKAILERAIVKVENFSLMGMFDLSVKLLDTNGNGVGFMRYYDGANPREDQQALDEIAVGLGTKPKWGGADELEWIANVVGRVRPHPGDSADTYVEEFKDATGRSAPRDYIHDDE